VHKYGDPLESFTLRILLLKVTQSHWNRQKSIDYLLVTSWWCSVVTMGLSRTVSEIESVTKFSHHVHLTPRWGGIPWKFVTAVGLQKLEWCPRQIAKTCDDMSIHLDTIPALDRRTDGRICHKNVAPRHALAWWRVITRSSADADNGLDAFSAQSRSTNMVPFWVNCDFSLSMWSAPRTTDSLHHFHSSSVL